MNHYFTYINHKKQTNIYITVIQHPNKNTYITISPHFKDVVRVTISLYSDDSGKNSLNVP